jgi:cellulose synthase/poly-beta-1,6-N-acetylglucosamine synthase-like glycosyltransferase/peptidoglycan/xylan/chitin deacetylase (PgdA/CDA1 family)/spore germination protein YaaH
MPHFLPDNRLRTAAALDSAHPSPRGPAPHPAARRARTSLRYAANPTDVPGRARGVVGGFYVNWDEVSLASLRQHAGELTHLFPGWLHLDDDGSRLVVKDSDPADAEALRLARANHLVIVPLLNNFSNGMNDFDEARLHAMLIDPAKRAEVVAQVKEYLLRRHYQGVNLDLETDNEDDRALLATFTAEVAAALHPSGLLVTADTQDGDPKQAAAVACSCDFVIPMIYDLHYASGTAGPIAPESWARAQLDAFLNAVPASKTVLAIGNYAYNWERGRAGAQTLTFGEAVATAHESQDGGDGVIRTDEDSGNPCFTYEDEGRRHDVWLLDAVTAYNFQRYAASRGVDGRALWYVGSEDPTLWSFFGRGRHASESTALETVKYGFEIDFEGEGEILDIAARPQVGSRTLRVAPDGHIAGEHYTRYPSVYIVRRSGQHRDGRGRLEKTLALTFDDGPDPRWTPAILDALKAAAVPATFFVIGENAEQHPDLLRREWNEGHEIGNHSFYHPNLAEVSPTRARLEVDATQRAIQSAIGRSTTLFRPPYGIDVEPSTSDEMRPVEEAVKLGYITVAEGIDPRDWDTSKHLTPEQIADGIVRGAQEGRGNVILLHDAGGDRSATVAALPIAVKRLRAKGYRFVPVSELLGHGSRDAFFPVLTGKERLVALVDRLVFGATAWTQRTVAFLFVFTLVGGTLRLLVVTLLALCHRKREHGQESTLMPGAPTLPSVSVIIAAYNEEKVIARTVRALLDGDYPHLEVIVVDDGSKDDTAGVVAREFGQEPRVRLLVKENGGKAAALNLGIAQATGDVLVGLDADTLFARDTVRRLARHFADPTVGAVAGNIQVGNRRNLLTRWQSVEYITSQNFDRRAYEVLNAIPVVPGCVSAWRASAVRAAGGYTSDTLAEDADLTWRVRRQGWRILSDSTARAYTEAPERLRDLAKQRFRWTFGTLQTLWKHRDALLRRRYGAFGCVVIPSLWLFQMALPLALPFADAGLVFAALSGKLAAALAYFLFFFAAEFAAAWLALRLDGASRSQQSDIGLLILQRIVFRYLLFYVLVRSLGAALRGTRAGWNKLERRGTATVGATS